MPGHVDVWLVDLDKAPLGARRTSLSAEELRRSRTFANAEARSRFVSTRNALREIIGARCGADPCEVEFEITPAGKPALASGSPSFSLSHCRNTALIAVSDDSPVGVDIERLRRSVDVNRIARRFFAPSEAARINTAEDQARAFFTAWTRAEAVAKASGEGFSQFRSIRFDPSATIARAGDLTWSINDIPLELPLIGALASQGKREIQLQRWVGRGV